MVTLRSPCSMRAYWNDPERTAEALSPDGWITTSDLGLFATTATWCCAAAPARCTSAVGSTCIRSRWSAWWPTTRVGRVAILGTPAPTIGEIGVAFVVPADPADPPTLEELRAFVRDRLADYKAPDRLEVVAELPMTSMLKIDKGALGRLSRADG